MMIHSVTPPKRPSVDVIIPTRNRAGLLGHCLESVRAQTLQPNSVIVVDDGSTDDTPGILEEYARSWPAIRVVRTPPRGVSAARNTALALSNAHLIALIDDDDIWDHDKLARQIELFTPDRPRLALVYCGLRQVDLQGEPLRHARDIRPTKRGDIFKDMLEQFHGIAPSTIVARRDAILAAGGFDEALVQAEDRDLCLKITRQWEADCVTDALVSLRVHSGGAYIHAKEQDPEFVLFQRLTVWNRWFDEIDAMEAVLNRFRAEALSASVEQMFRSNPRFGLFRRLAMSELQLARSLFKHRLHFFVTLLPYLASKPSFHPSRDVPSIRSYADLKVALATMLILPNKRLLRLAQKLGRFRNVEPPVKPPGGDGRS